MSNESSSQTNGIATPEFLTAEEVSSRLRLPLSTVYHLAKTGVLPAIQLGRTWRLPSHAINELVGHKSTPAQILVVDDDVVTRTLVVELLRPRGYLLVEAGDAEAGLAAARQQRFDLLFIDFKLPGRDGTELVLDLKEKYAVGQMVMITAFPDLVQINKLFELGALTLLRKPLEPVRLLECVDQILGTRAQEIKRGNREQFAGRTAETAAQVHRQPETLPTGSTTQSK